MQGPATSTVRIETRALLVSLGIHVALVAALVIPGAPSDSEPSPLASRAGAVVWVDLPVAPQAARSREPTRSDPEAPKTPPPTQHSDRTGSPPPPTPAPRIRPRPAAQVLEARETARATPAAPASKRHPATLRSSTSQASTTRHATAEPGPTAAPTRLAAAAPRTSEHDPESASRTAGARPPAWPGAAHVDRPARPRSPIRPKYPHAARRRGEESTVLVEAWVDDGGRVALSSILESGGDVFDDSALSAVNHASFRPARLEGRPIPSRVALRIHFALHD